MILLKIANASELVASKLGGVVERLTPDGIDNSTVEDLVVRKLIENLEKEGIKGEISSLNGINVNEDELILTRDLKVRNHIIF